MLVVGTARSARIEELAAHVREGYIACVLILDFVEAALPTTITKTLPLLGAHLLQGFFFPKGSRGGRFHEGPSAFFFESACLAQGPELRKVIMIKVNDRIVIPWDELDISYARSGGPGGQNVNKRETKAVLSWNPTLSPSLPDDVRLRFLDTFSSRLTEDGRIVIASDEHRSQDMNLKSCFDKLQKMILLVVKPPKIRRPTKPTKGSKIRRVTQKKIQSETKKNRQKVRQNYD